MKKEHFIVMAAVAAVAYIFYKRTAAATSQPVTGAGGFVLNQWAKV
jgi:hypothetical protein